ncbi:MAG: transglutaminase-like domain-containing protein, partial [bacterium]
MKGINAMLSYIRTSAILVGLIALCGLLFQGCQRGSTYPPEVEKSVSAAGTNRAALEQVIAHFAQDPDTLKLQAAYYLIANMEEHSYATYALKDSSGNEVDFNVNDYDNYEDLLAGFDELETEHGTLDFERGDKILDLENVSAEFLIGQIDRAFRAWHEKPWAQWLDFELFRDYVLPYRGSNEPLEPWREFFWDKYAHIAEHLQDSTDPVAAAALINDDVRGYFTFDPRYYYHPTDQGLGEMLQSGLGRCEDMTNITIYALRANGIAVTSDYTPYWADAGNNHAWNSIVTRDGTVIPFMGAEANPGDYGLANKVAKVYRKMFGEQTQNLAFQGNKQESMPRWLAGKNYLDVTADYVDECDVTVRFEREIPDSVNVAYLCVFNSGEWKAIHWAKIEDSSATFTDMGPDLAYLPALYLNEEIFPWGPAFILGSDCGQTAFVPNHDSTIALALHSTTIRAQVASTDGIAGQRLTEGQEYELQYWEDGW